MPFGPWDCPPRAITAIGRVDAGGEGREDTTLGGEWRAYCTGGQVERPAGVFNARGRSRFGVVRPGLLDHVVHGRASAVVDCGMPFGKALADDAPF